MDAAVSRVPLHPLLRDALVLDLGSRDCVAESSADGGTTGDPHRRCRISSVACLRPVPWSGYNVVTCLGTKELHLEAEAAGRLPSRMLDLNHAFLRGEAIFRATTLISSPELNPGPINANGAKTAAYANLFGDWITRGNVPNV